MISKFMYDAVYQPRRFLQIEPYAEQNHISNFYYFRLGGIDHDGEVVRPVNGSLRVQGNSMLAVWSLEEFSLSERVLGLFGPTSDLVHKGLQLVHSPSIDPGFTGSLALGLKNNTGSAIDIDV